MRFPTGKFHGNYHWNSLENSQGLQWEVLQEFPWDPPCNFPLGTSYWNSYGDFTRNPYVNSDGNSYPDSGEILTGIPMAIPVGIP